MIDLHTHTTASDGRLPPSELVARAAGVGVTVLSITDHDTVAAAGPAAEACALAGLTFVPGIEITAARNETDVHILGYFIDVSSASLQGFLTEQRQRRVDRVRQIVARLDQLGMYLDADALVRPALDDPAKSAGRPWVARAMVMAGYVATPDLAFQKWLSRGRPAYIPRIAPPPDEVVRQIHLAGGLASLAHPGLLRRDEWIPEFIGAGLDAIEAFHSQHDAAASQRYVELAKSSGALVSGGSDYHGDGMHGAPSPGAATLPPDAFAALKKRIGHN